MMIQIQYSIQYTLTGAVFIIHRFSILCILYTADVMTSSTEMDLLLGLILLKTVYYPKLMKLVVDSREGMCLYHVQNEPTLN